MTIQAGEPIRAAVVGAGSWGTALAQLLHRNGHRVSLWTFEEKVARQIRKEGENSTYLPGVVLSPEIQVSSDLEETVSAAELVVSVSPAQHVGEVMGKAAPYLSEDALVVTASKGIEIKTLRRMDEVLNPLLSPPAAERLSVISGPSFAVEVARGLPTAVVAASRSLDARLSVQAIFSSTSFRVYTNSDVLGVELGGALKNVIALAAGVSAGLDFGHNTQAALITRGLAEITRLGVAMGAEAATFYGLAGMGDLVLTCTGDLSRNRGVGVRLGKGEDLSDILASMNAVVEGVRTAPAVHALARRYEVEMPIVDQVCAILEDGKSPRAAVQDLLLRDPKPESWG